MTEVNRGHQTSPKSAAATSSHAQRLLRCGVVAGPFYLAVGLIQALLRDGFDFARHPLSVLANGPGGWVQTANFVITGLMVLAAAMGFGRVLGPKSRAMTWFLGGFGVAMIVAAMFPADPVDGFPAGHARRASPTSISTTGLVHFAAGGLGLHFPRPQLLLRGMGDVAPTTCRHWRASRSSAASPSLVGFFGGMAASPWGSSESGSPWSSGGHGSRSCRSS